MSAAKPDRPEWIIAKAHGDRAELAVAAWFKSRGFEPWRSLGPADVDLLLQCRVEVKHDLQAEKTGNIAIETSYRRRASGILDSSANYWAFVVADEAFIVKTETLRTFVLRGGLPEVPAGDNGAARVKLVKIERLRTLKGVNVVPLPGDAA